MANDIRQPSEFEGDSFPDERQGKPLAPRDTEREAHLAALFAQTAAGLAETELSGRFVDVNERYCEIVGRSRDQLLGLTMQEITHPDDLPGNVAKFNELVTGGPPFQIEKRYLRPDGSAVWVNNSVSLLRRPHGDAETTVLAFSVDISERKEAEAALREREQRLKLVIDGATDYAIFTTDPDRRVTSWSRGAELAFGYEADEIVGQSADVLWTPEDRAKGQPEKEIDIARGTGCANNERWHQRKDGSRVFMNGSVQPLPPEDDGTERGFIKIAQDETERRATQQALSESEQRFRGLVETSSRVLYRHNADWSEMRQLAGNGFLADTDQPDPDWFNKYIHPDDQPFIRQRIDEAIRTKSAFELEHRVIREDGTLGWTASRSIPILDENGDIVEWFGAASDVSDRHEIEDALIESEARFRNMADHAPVMMWVTEPDAHCSYLNKAWYDFTGQSEEEALGLGWLRAVHPDDAAESERIFLEANARRAPFSLEYRLRRHDGAYRWAIDTASPRFGPKGEFAGYIGSVLEIHDRKREEGLNAARNRVLALAVEDHPVEQTLGELIKVIEAESGGEVLGSILLLDTDRRRLLHGAAPSLPDAYNQAIDGIEIGDGVGSCGTAAHQGEAVYVSDIATDPLWNDFKDLAAEHGLAACWSIPILGTSGEVLGTFAMYHRQPKQPAPDDLRLVDYVTRTAALIIERHQAEQQSREQRQTLATLNRVGSAIAAELDLERVVQLVTDAAVELTGARFGAFFYNVVDAAGERYMLYTLSGVERSAFEKFPMPRNTAVFEPTFSGTGVIRSDDITKDPRYGKNAPYHGMPEGHLPVVSYLAVPVVGQSGETMGGLFFGHDEPGRFSENHETLLTAIAGQAAVAIDKARLYRDAQREIENRVKAEQAVRMLNETLESRVAEEVERRARSEDALHQLQKMETVGQLSGGIAHDFNNLLQVIHGNLSLLQKAIDPQEARLQRWTGNAILGAERAAALTQRLLAFSRRQPLAPRAVDANRLIAGMTELLIRTLGETIAFASELEAGLWLAEVDPNQLENALLNLAVNARDAMPDGGRMTIETRNFVIDKDYAEKNPGTAPGQFILICVSDEGVGMDAATVERAIEPFFTTKEVGKGTGLGLSMVYGFAEQSGGHFRIYSEPGQGTTAKIYLPRHVGAGDHVDDERRSDELLRGRGETILLCEDDDEVRQFSADTLRGLGYEVIEASDAADALMILRDGSRIDLVFSDVVLPGGVTGVDLARQAREERPELKILYTSGYARTALHRQGRLEPGIELIPKPFTLADLSARLRALLD